MSNHYFKTNDDSPNSNLYLQYKQNRLSSPLHLYKNIKLLQMTMKNNINHILIIADIEGSSGCWNYGASSFMTDEWAHACVSMSLDMDAVVRALYDAGVKKITIKDFHRTGYNLLPELIDPRAKIVSGYIKGPVPGLGDPEDAEVLMLIGMHAASGSGSFLAHTLTSRVASLRVKERLMSEVELFSASLAHYGIRPVFFSGCPAACEQAEETIKGIGTYGIDKSSGPGSIDIMNWRAGLANAAVESLNNNKTEPYLPKGPFHAILAMRDGEEAAKKIADRWRLDREGNNIFLRTSNINDLYNDLIRICYLTPGIERMITPALFLYNLWGRLGLAWARKRMKNIVSTEQYLSCKKNLSSIYED